MPALAVAGWLTAGLRHAAAAFARPVILRRDFGARAEARSRPGTDLTLACEATGVA